MAVSVPFYNARGKAEEINLSVNDPKGTPVVAECLQSFPRSLIINITTMRSNTLLTKSL